MTRFLSFFPLPFSLLLFLHGFHSVMPLATVTTPAVVDRIEEEEWLVFDISPYPSLPVPRRLGPTLREGDALTVTVQLTVTGAFALQGRDSRGLVLGDSEGTFHWPEALAPAPLEIGDRVAFTLTPAPA